MLKVIKWSADNIALGSWRKILSKNVHQNLVVDPFLILVDSRKQSIQLRNILWIRCTLSRGWSKILKLWLVFCHWIHSLYMDRGGVFKSLKLYNVEQSIWFVSSFSWKLVKYNRMQSLLSVFQYFFSFLQIAIHVFVTRFCDDKT